MNPDNQGQNSNADHNQYSESYMLDDFCGLGFRSFFHGTADFSSR
jgi:hypothetical protein